LTVTLNVSDTTLTARKARLQLSDSTNRVRFYVFDGPAGCVPTVELHTPGTLEELFRDKNSYSYKSYKSEYDLAAGATGRFEWKVWMQPSVETSLAFNARLFEPRVDSNNNPIEVILEQTLAKLVTVQQAAIYPIVFVPGLGATQPPRYGNWSIVEDKIGEVTHYTDLFTTLEKMGFERDRTYFLFNYDWLTSNIISAKYLREALEDQETTAAAVPWVASYGNSSSVEFDLIGHSTGNMVARTYIQVDQGFDPATNQTFPIWNDNVRRWVSIAGPLEGIWDIYGKEEGLTFPTNPVQDPVMWSALYLWGLGRALEANYARIVFRPCVGSIGFCPYLDWGAEEKYQFAHDPVRGPTIVPEFLPTYPYLVNNNGNPTSPSGDNPFGRTANPLLEDQSVVNGSITLVSQVEQAIANPNVGFNRAAMSGLVFDFYTQNPRLGSGRWGQTVPTGFQTRYHGLNTTPGLQLLNTRLGGVDQNLCLIYGGRLTDQQDADTVDKLEVTDPSHRDVPPYWFNGRIEDVTNLKGVGYIYGQGDGYVLQDSASAQGIWQGVGVEPHRLNVDDGTQHPDPKSLHRFIAGYDVSVKEVARCLAGIRDLPEGMLAGFSPADHSTAQANYDAVTGRILGLTALSPIELLLTDPLGRRLGYDPTTAQDVSEIPNATYIRDTDTTHKYLAVLAPTTGAYTLTITGTGDGSYTVVGMFKEGQNVVNVFASQGMASPGSTVSETFVTPQTAAEVPAPPDVEAGPSMTTVAGQPVTFAGSFSDINPDETHTITWDFGDGQSASGTLTPTHTYALAGAYTATLTVTDNAGFVISDTLTVNVQYAFTGFFQPVDNLPTLNTVKAGSAIPVKFSLSGDYGLNIFATGHPSSSIVTCGSTAEDAIEQTVTAGGSSLSYDAVTGQYTYVWKTDKAWANTCRTLVVKLNDGTSYKANFKFKP
jgi:PKD repeat protein